MAAIDPPYYRLTWDQSTFCWVFWNGRWPLGSITGFPPGRPQVDEKAAREWADRLFGPLEWDGRRARPKY